MRITLIVADNTIYINGRVATVDLSEFAATYRAVQWQENSSSVGHIELIDGANQTIDEKDFAVFLPFVERANAVLLKADEEARAQAQQASSINNNFFVNRFSIQDFNIYRVTAKNIGATMAAGDRADIDRQSSSIRVSMVTRGSRRYSSVKDRFPPAVLSVGDFNLDLPNMDADDSYVVTALTADTEYYCISKKDLSPYSYDRFKIEVGETIEVPSGKNVFIGGGVTDAGTGPILVPATESPKSITVLFGTAFGLVF